MKRTGFIIPVTLMLVSMAVILITVIYRRGSVYVPFMSTMIQQHKARQFALSGVQVAMSQLAHVPEQKENKVPTQSQLDMQLLLDILPALNRWQIFNLKKDVDGADGEIKFCISCEDGKIDLNAIYDFTNKKFKGNWKKMMQEFFTRVQKQINSDANLFVPFEKLLKERQYRFNDASELLTLESFGVFDGRVFYVPPIKGQKGKRPVYLMDLFTTYGSIDKLQPWLLSDSVCVALGIKHIQANIQEGKEQVKNWIKKFTPTTNWQQKWNEVLKPVYSIELQSLPNGIDSILDDKFDPKMFCVVSYGKVGATVQRAYAIIERIQRKDKNNVSYDCKIKKLYWI